MCIRNISDVKREKFVIGVVLYFEQRESFIRRFKRSCEEYTNNLERMFTWTSNEVRAINFAKMKKKNIAKAIERLHCDTL
jgi:hypothetical protein